MSWIVSLFDGPLCFVNDINHQSDVGCHHRCDELPGIGQGDNFGVRLCDEKELLLVSYEDARLLRMRNNPIDEDIFGVSEKTRDVLLLRDPFNMIASRIKLMRDQPRNGFVRNFLLPDESGESQLTKRWIFLAEEFVGITNHLQNTKLMINYNEWCVSEGYRRSISSKLGRKNREKTLQAVPAYGFGSSFDRMSRNGDASSMQLDRRWENYIEDREYLGLIRNQRLIELSEKIFGSVLDHNEICENLKL